MKLRKKNKNQNQENNTLNEMYNEYEKQSQDNEIKVADKTENEMKSENKVIDTEPAKPEIVVDAEPAKPEIVKNKINSEQKKRNLLTEEQIKAYSKKIASRYKVPYKRTKVKKALTLLTLGTGMVAFSYAYKQDLITGWLETYINTIQNTLDPEAISISFSDFINKETLSPVIENINNDYKTIGDFNTLTNAFGASFGARVLASIIPSTKKKADKKKIAKNIKNSNLSEDNVKDLDNLARDMGSCVAVAPEVHLAKMKYEENTQSK